MSNELLFTIPLGSWARSAVDWLTANLKGLFNWLSDDLLLPMYRFLANLLRTPDFVSIGVILIIIFALWKGWKAGVAAATAVALGYILSEFVTGGSLAVPWWVVALVFAAIAAGVYFWKGTRVGLIVLATLFLAFAIDQWFLVDHVTAGGAVIPASESLPEWTIGALLTLIAFTTKGWRLALGSVIGFAIIYGVDQWTNAMSTFALVLVASIIAVVIGIPIGILAAKNRGVSTAVRPILDFLQTMPAFVYLIPFVVLFGIGVVPGIVATILFSIAPAVRFTELGIKQVDKEVVEAAHAFGAHPSRILGQIELPLARATIMGGVNQVIMLALSMVVIAGMVGAGGLGQDVYTSVTQVNISLGAESGLSVVILAMYLDRVTAAFGTSKHEQLAG
ncbi:ABC transporter permease [Flaviflexus huanghaiensis]|uniref:ABC transporter permease n=1 Tax=Flaviflexus huanghaiensis TaxID=1111473 RepID=UPI001F50A662|nr:ABC transporter permease subunit [Flaviflexus huanghaiensis]